MFDQKIIILQLHFNKNILFVLMEQEIPSDVLQNAIMNDIFLEGKPTITTPIGIIVKCSLSTVIPPGWRRLTRQQGAQIKPQLMQILDTWSIVAFENGKIHGNGYGGNIDESYGIQCGEMFLIKQMDQFVAPPVIQQVGPSVLNYSPVFVLPSPPSYADCFKQSQLYQQKNFGQPYLQNAPTQHVKYQNKQYSQDTPKISFQEQFLNRNKNIKTGLGLVAKCSLNDELPAGWRIMTRQEGQQIKHQLNKILDAWSIVAFSNGKIDGKGYGNVISNSYGNQCGEVFVITQTF